MKSLYIVSFVKNKMCTLIKKNMIISYAFLFENEEEALKFKSYLKNDNMAYISKHEIFNTCEEAIKQLEEN